MQKKFRLAKREDFSKIYRHGKSTANHQFVVYQRKRSGAENFRLGVSVSKKIGNAVVRNRLRRRMKEIVRAHKDYIDPHVDMIIIARKPSTEMDYKEMEKSIIHVLKRASLYKKK